MRDDSSVDLHTHKNTLLTALLAHSLRLKSEAQCGIISSRKATKANVSCGVLLFGLAELADQVQCAPTRGGVRPHQTKRTALPLFHVISHFFSFSF